MKRCTFKKIYYQLAFLVLTGLPGLVSANPINPLVLAGKARFENPNPSTLVVNTPSERLVINWDSFSVNKGELTKFAQPGKDSAVLNRVTGGSRSDIFGAIDANGRVYLINPNGILIDKNAQINTSAFLASALDVSDQEFLDGGDLRFFGDSKGTVINFGTINAFDGDVILLGFQVDNQGNIIAPNGTAGLAAGQEILLQVGSDKKFLIHPKQTAKEDGTGVNVGGVIQALRAEVQADGAAYNLAINHSGIVEATGVVNRGGQVYLCAEGGDTFVNGRIRADESVHVLGKRVGVYGNADIDTSNQNSGGNVWIGGGYKGSDENVYNSNNTYVAQGAKINSSSIQQGDAGNVIVWGDTSTKYYGDIQARGGSEAGNGGFVEVSGKGYLDFNGVADRSAQNGQAGTLLLDPSSITIINANSADLQTNNITPNLTEYTPNANNSTISTATIIGALGTGDVIVATGENALPGDGNIYWPEGFDISTGSANTLTLDSINSIYMGSLYENTGAGGVVFKAQNDIVLQNNNLPGADVGISTISGDITFDASNIYLLESVGPIIVQTTSPTTPGNIYLDARNGNFRMEGGVAAVAPDPNNIANIQSTGHINLNVYNGDASLSGGTGSNSIAQISGNTVSINVPNGSLTLQGSNVPGVEAAFALIQSFTGVDIETGSDLNLFSGGVQVTPPVVSPLTGSFAAILNQQGDMNFAIGGDVNLIANTNSNGDSLNNAFVQIGSITVGQTNNINFTKIGGNLNLIAPLDQGANISYAAIGNGNFNTVNPGPILGNINITGSEGTTITLQDGVNVTGTFAQIGHFGTSAGLGDITGNISINGVGQGIVLNPGFARAMIGHGAVVTNVNDSITGNIDIDIPGGDLDLGPVPVTAAGSFALIGHFNGTSHTGDVNVDLNGGELRIRGSDQVSQFAGIGFASTVATVYQGKVSVDAETIDVIGGSNAGSVAFIGFRNGSNLLPVSSVTVGAESNILIQAGSNAVTPAADGGNAFIGYRNTTSGAFYLDSINVTSRQGNISLYGGTGATAFGGQALIGVGLDGAAGATVPQSPVKVQAPNGILALYGVPQTSNTTGGAAIISTNAISEPFDLIIDVGTLSLIGGTTAPATGAGSAIINSPFNTNITTKNNLELYALTGTSQINTGVGQSTFEVGKDLIVQAGTGLARIGNPNPNVNYADLTFKDVGGDVVVQAGTVAAAYAVIGHGNIANAVAGSYTGNIVFDHIGGNVRIQGGSAVMAIAPTANIGHIGSNTNTSNLFGDIILKKIDGSLQILGGSGIGSTATLGHGNQTTVAGIFNGYIEAHASSVNLIAGPVEGSHATIGFTTNNGGLANIDSEGIYITSADGFVLQAGNGSNAVIGLYNPNLDTATRIQSINLEAISGSFLLNAGILDPVAGGGAAFIGTSSDFVNIFPASNIEIKAAQDVILTVPANGAGSIAAIANTNNGFQVPYDVTIDANAIILLSGTGPIPPPVPAPPTGSAFIYSGGNVDLTFSDRLDINYDAYNPNTLQIGDAEVEAYNSIFINTHAESLAAINIQGPSELTNLSQIDTFTGDVIIGTENFTGAGAVTIGSLSTSQPGGAQIRSNDNVYMNIKGPLDLIAGVNLGDASIFAINNVDITTENDITLYTNAGQPPPPGAQASITSVFGNNSVESKNGDITLLQTSRIQIIDATTNGLLNVAAASKVSLTGDAFIQNSGVGDTNVTAGLDIIAADGAFISVVGSGDVNLLSARDITLTDSSVLSGGGINSIAGRDTILTHGTISQMGANDGGINVATGRDLTLVATAPDLSVISQTGTGDTILAAGQDFNSNRGIVNTNGEITTVSAGRDQNHIESSITQTAPKGVFTASAGQDMNLDVGSIFTTNAATASVTAGQDIFVEGGSVINHTGISTFNFNAGEDINILGGEEVDSLVQTAATVANVDAGQDFNLTGGGVFTQSGTGQLNLNAGNDVNVVDDSVLTTTAADTHIHAAKDVNILDDSLVSQTGTSIFDMAAGEDVNIDSSIVSTDADDASFTAGQDINISNALVNHLGTSKLRLDAGEDINVISTILFSNAKDIVVDAEVDITLTDSIIQQTGGDALKFNSGQGILVDGVTQILSPAEDVSFTAGLDIKFEDNAVVEHTGSGFFTVDARENFFMNQNARITTQAFNGTFNAGVNMFMTGNTMINFNSSGIQTYNIGLDMTLKNNAMITTSDATSVFNVGRDIFLDSNAKILSFGNRDMTITAGHDIIMDDDALIHSQNNELTILAGHSMTMKERNIIENEFGNVTIVVDNKFPNPPFFGTGGFRMSNGSKIFTPEGTTRIFTSRRAFNSIHGRINGYKFTPGIEFINTAEEQWHTYYNTAIKGVPFTVFYKNSGKPKFPHHRLTPRILHDFRIATSEAFVDWRYYDRFYFDSRCLDVFSTCAYTCDVSESDLLAQYRIIRQLYHNRHTVQYDLISALPF